MSFEEMLWNYEAMKGENDETSKTFPLLTGSSNENNVAVVASK